jgi:CRP-like cAMP-binding protein
VTLDLDVMRLMRTRPFSLLPREAVQLLAFSCGKRALSVGDLLFAVGESADEAYFLLSGAIDLTDAAKGASRRVAPGALIGESALHAASVRRVEARAIEDSVLVRVPRETFRRVLSEFPAAAAMIRAELAQRTRALVDRLDASRAASLDGERPAARAAP